MATASGSEARKSPSSMVSYARARRTAVSGLARWRSVRMVQSGEDTGFFFLLGSLFVIGNKRTYASCPYSQLQDNKQQRAFNVPRKQNLNEVIIFYYK